MLALYRDPMAEMFVQTFQHKKSCLSLLNKTCSMEDIKTSFIDTYSQAMKNLDELFMNSFQITDSTSILDTLTNKTHLNNLENQFHQESNQSQNTLKRTKMSQTEYIEKVLLDFSYHNENAPFLEITNRSSLPLNNEIIRVDLKNNKVTIEEEVPQKIEEPELIPNNQETENDIVNEVQSELPQIEAEPQLIILTEKKKKSIPNPSLGEVTFKKENSNMFTLSKNNANKENEDKENIPKAANTFIQNIPNYQSPPPCSSLLSKPIVAQSTEPLRKSLFDKFEQVDMPNSTKIYTVDLPSDDRAFNQDLEELIQGIEKYHSSQKLTPKHVPGATGLDTSFKSFANKESTEYFTANDTSNLTNKIHDILYSQIKQNDHEHLEQHQHYATFEETYSEDPFNNDLDDECYDVSDYSNDSDAPAYYKFQEQYEEIKPQKPCMFEYYNNIQLNLTNSEALNTFGNFNNQPPGNSSQNPGFAVNNGFIPGCDNANYDYSMGCQSNNNNTMFCDYMYYLKQQQEQMNGPEPAEDREERLRNMDVSPSKPQQIKRIYCNSKKVPLWATNLEQVEKISKDQKKIFNPNHIFGHFNVENLDLVDIFQMKTRRLLAKRGSSANWKNEISTPSNQKMTNIKGFDFDGVEFTNTKKTIKF